MKSAAGFSAALFHAPSEPLQVERFPLPPLSPGEVLVRVTCCTLCGSDFHTVRGRRVSPRPSILGHEIVGIIEDLSPAGGPIVDAHGGALHPGDRVTWSIVVSCGACPLCRGGLPQKCVTLFKYGHEQFHQGGSPSGGLSQICVLRRGTAIFRVAADLPDGVAAAASCAAATVMAVFRTAGPVDGSPVLIQGAGMLGLIAAAVARDSGATVLLTDPDPVRRNRAAAFGAAHLLDCGPGAPPLPEQVRQLTGGRGVEVAMEFSGSPEAAEAALPLLGPGARYVLAGSVFPSRPAALSLETIVRKMIRIAGVHNYATRDLAAALEFLESRAARYPFGSLIARSFPLREVNEALEWAEAARPPRVAIVPEAG